MVITPRAGGFRAGLSSGMQTGRHRSAPAGPPGAGLSSCSQPGAGSAGLEKTPKETLLLCFPKAGTAASVQEWLVGKRVAGELERAGKWLRPLQPAGLRQQDGQDPVTGAVCCQQPLKHWSNETLASC